MALLLEHKQVYGIFKGGNNKLQEQAVNATATDKAAFKDQMSCHGIASLTILLDIEPTVEAKYTVVNDGKTLWD